MKKVTILLSYKITRCLCLPLSFSNVCQFTYHFAWEPNFFSSPFSIEVIVCKCAHRAQPNSFPHSYFIFSCHGCIKDTNSPKENGRKKENREKTCRIEKRKTKIQKKNSMKNWGSFNSFTFFVSTSSIPWSTKCILIYYCLSSITWVYDVMI